MNQSTILVVAYHFYPSSEIGARRPTELARYLADKGLRVLVLSTFGGVDVELGTEILPGVVALPVAPSTRRFVDMLVKIKRFIRSQPAPSDRAVTANNAGDGVADRKQGLSVRERFFRMIYLVDENKKWGWHAARLAIKKGRESGAKLIFSTSPPPSTLLAGAYAARKLRIPHVVDFRDPWVDAVLAQPVQSGLENGLLKRLETWVLNSSAAVTSTGTLLLDLIRRRHPGISAKCHVIRNGYDSEIHQLDSDTGGRLSILFAGELYMGRNPFPFLRALEGLLSLAEVDAGRVSVVFMGRVTSYKGQSLAEWLEGKRAANVVRIVPPQPAEKVALAVRDCTVVLNLAQNQRLSVPAKTFEHLASGRENLLICERESETAALVGGVEGVLRADPEDCATLQDILLDLYRRHVNLGKLRAPAAASVSMYSRAAANRQFWSIMNAVAQLDVREVPLPGSPVQRAPD